MKIFRRLTQLIAAGMLIFASSQVYATAYNLANYAWGYSSTGDGQNIVTISNNSFSFEGYTLVEVQTDSGTGDLSQGAIFTDYLYLTNTQTGVYATATLQGEVSAGTNDVTFYNTASTSYDTTVTDQTMTWYTSSGIEILTLDLVSDSTLGLQGNTDMSVFGTDNQYLKVGEVVLYLEVSSITSGYFFIYDTTTGTWIDFADLISAGDELLLTSGTFSSAATDDVSSGAYDYISGDSGEDPNNYIANVGNTGNVIDLTTAYQGGGLYSYTLAQDGGIDVDTDAISTPEPGMLSLMGLAFLGLAGLQRRRKMQIGTDVKLN